MFSTLNGPGESPVFRNKPFRGGGPLPKNKYIVTCSPAPFSRGTRRETTYWHRSKQPVKLIRSDTPNPYALTANSHTARNNAEF